MDFKNEDRAAADVVAAAVGEEEVGLAKDCRFPSDLTLFRGSCAKDVDRYLLQALRKSRVIHVFVKRFHIAGR